MRRRGTQTHMNLALLLAASLISLAHLAGAPGVAECLIYLGPVIFALLLLWFGRYPGEKVLQAQIKPRKRRLKAGRIVSRQVCVGIPRGAALLASAMAGRAPPVARDSRLRGQIPVALDDLSKPAMA